LTTAIKDVAGNALAATSWTFTTGPAPTISARTPGVNATAVSATSSVTATFSENVTGVSGSTFTVKNAAGTAVTATVAYNATTRVATLTHATAFANDTKYTVTLTGGTTAIRDAAGNPLATTSWTFTTGPAPTVTATTPANLATGFGRTANVTATFSEAVTGVSTTTFTLRPVSSTGVLGTAVPAVVSRNGTTNQWILNPSVARVANTKYRVTLTGGTTAVRDVAGNPLTTKTWDFTTGTV
jgi:hypothetical protein